MKKFGDMRILRSVKPTRCEFDPGGKRQTLCVEFNAGLLDFRVGQKPDKGFIVKINNLDAIAPWIAKIAAERRLQFEFVFLGKFLSDFFELRFIANHDPEMTHVRPLHLFHFKNREELMLA